MMHSFANHPQSALMARVLDIRYTNLEEELALCRELLAWAEENGDAYARLFAHTYLGDYYIAQNDSTTAAGHLETAEMLLDETLCNAELELKVYSFLAILHEMRADEQNSVQYYLKSLALARKLGDTLTECMVLNNLAFAFQHHSGYEQALEYYESAYALQAGMENPPFRAALLTNLAMLLLHLSRPAEALRYIEECEALDAGPDNQPVHRLRNRCIYAAATGNKREALKLAAEIRPLVRQLNENRLSAFENYDALCESMLLIQNEVFARFFLEQMEEASQGGGLHQLYTLENRRLAVHLSFGKAEECKAAYRRFYQKTRELKTLGNQLVAGAMKAQINLEQAIAQRQELLDKQEQLEHQANADELTQLENRRSMEQRMARRAEDPGEGSFAVIMLDVDYFKEYNDFYGHRKGDVVLQTIGACLRENAAKGISPCRYGGDEFTCLCDGLSQQDVRQYIERVRACLCQMAVPHEKSGCSDVVTLSIGYSFAPGGGEGATPYQLLQLADQALYETKQAGRNAFTGKQVDGL